MLDWMNLAMQGKQLCSWIEEGELIFKNAELGKQWGSLRCN